MCLFFFLSLSWDTHLLPSEISVPGSQGLDYDWDLHHQLPGSLAFRQQIMGFLDLYT